MRTVLATAYWEGTGSPSCCLPGLAWVYSWLCCSSLHPFSWNERRENEPTLRTTASSIIKCTCMRWDTIQPTYARDDVGADTRMTSVGVAMPASYTVWWGDTRRQPSHPVPIPMDMIEDRMVESESESESQAKTGNAVSMLFRFFFITIIHSSKQRNQE